MKNFIVCNPDRPGNPPIAHHDTFEKAKREAERLALLNPGQTFYVMQAVGYCIKKDVEWVLNNTHDDGLPF